MQQPSNLQQAGVFQASAGGMPNGQVGLPPNARPGDWMCPACNNHNYADKFMCNRCRAPRPAGLGPVPVGSGKQPAREMRPGDWICPRCSNHNFADKIACNKCMWGAGMGLQPAHGMTAAQASGYNNAIPAHTAAQAAAQAAANQVVRNWARNTILGTAQGPKPVNMRPGDWICRACNNHNYADKTECNRCKMPKHVYIAATGLRPGDWVCPQCSNHNFASKLACNKCSLPKQAALEMQKAAAANSNDPAEVKRTRDWE